MKKIFSVIAIGAMVMGIAGTASAWTSSRWTASESFNQQAQQQNLVGVNGGANGMITATTQEQKGNGYSNSFWGSEAFEGQAQGELTKLPINNGFAVHHYNQNVVTYGNSNVDDFGHADHSELQTLDSGIATVGDGNGTFSVSGMATVGGANSEAYSWDLWGDAKVQAGTEAMYNNSYRYKNVGDNSRIIQTGVQGGHYTTNVSAGDSQYAWWGGSESSAAVTAQQVGGTAALNDGNGTYMAGGGAAEGSVKVTASAADGSWFYSGDANANASAEQGQQHSYKQFANNGAGQHQWAAGTVGTYNNASVHVSD
jgi:hypothetical protein